MKIRCTVNGAPAELDVAPTESLLTALRLGLGLRSVRETCGIGVCGACTALVNGATISTCIMLAPLAEGADIVTAEAVPIDDPVRRAFAEEHAFQCGYCTPGLVLTTKALLAENPRPDDDEIRLALAGNLCRCGCYVKILGAVRRAAATIP